jgi:predicted nucleic-acid-binding protein
MIAIDTNVLVRLLVADDLEQAAAAQQLLEGAAEAHEPCFLSDPVLCELEWVLVSRYRARRAEVATAFLGLLGKPLFVFEDRTAILRAVESYQQSRADLSDHLIGAKARARGATTTWTFDRALRGCAGFSLLG